MKLTKAQSRCLISVAAGTVGRAFDVYAGYMWSDGDHRTRWKRSEIEAPAPIRALTDKGLIALGPTTRPYSGSQLAKYELTDAGRIALSEAEGGE